MADIELVIKITQGDYDWIKRTSKGNTCYPCTLRLYDAIKDGKPQEPKTGRWIGHREHCENLGVMPSGLGAYEWCSNCDCGIDVREWHRNNYNYCPNCGAKMVEPQEKQCADCTHYGKYCGRCDDDCSMFEPQESEVSK